MNRKEHLLTKLAEECLETGQRATKALRFGLKEVQEGQGLDNSQRIIDEYMDILAVLSILFREGHANMPPDSIQQITQKEAKFEKFLEYSKSVGTLTE